MDKMQEVDIMEVKREELPDIDTIKLDKMEAVEKKMKQLTTHTEGSMFTHLNDGYVVRVHFGNSDYTATDALKHYIKQMAELK